MQSCMSHDLKVYAGILNVYRHLVDRHVCLANVA